MSDNRGEQLSIATKLKKEQSLHKLLPMKMTRTQLILAIIASLVVGSFNVGANSRTPTDGKVLKYLNHCDSLQSPITVDWRYLSAIVLEYQNKGTHSCLWDRLLDEIRQSDSKIYRSWMEVMAQNYGLSPQILDLLLQDLTQVYFEKWGDQLHKSEWISERFERFREDYQYAFWGGVATLSALILTKGRSFIKTPKAFKYKGAAKYLGKSPLTRRARFGFVGTGAGGSTLEDHLDQKETLDLEQEEKVAQSTQEADNIPPTPLTYAFDGASFMGDMSYYDQRFLRTSFSLSGGIAMGWWISKYYIEEWGERVRLNFYNSRIHGQGLSLEKKFYQFLESKGLKRDAFLGKVHKVPLFKIVGAATVGILSEKALNALSDSAYEEILDYNYKIIKNRAQESLVEEANVKANTIHRYFHIEKWYQTLISRSFYYLTSYTNELEKEIQVYRRDEFCYQAFQKYYVQPLQCLSQKEATTPLSPELQEQLQSYQATTDQRGDETQKRVGPTFKAMAQVKAQYQYYLSHLDSEWYQMIEVLMQQMMEEPSPVLLTRYRDMLLDAQVYYQSFGDRDISSEFQKVYENQKQQNHFLLSDTRKEDLKALEGAYQCESSPTYKTTRETRNRFQSVVAP